MILMSRVLFVMCNNHTHAWTASHVYYRKWYVKSKPAVVFILRQHMGEWAQREKNSRPLIQHLYSSGFSRQPQDMKARTLPLMTALQMGQWRRLAAQSPHTTRCPQGMKTMDTSLSMHTLQVLSSCSCLSSSSGLGSFTAGRKTTQQKKHCWRTEQLCVIYWFSTLRLSKWHKLFFCWSYRCWPLTSLSDGCLCPHVSGTGALPRLCRLWRTQKQ